MMPGLDGFGVLRSLRAHERTRTIPVILLSARAGEEAAVEGLDAGADDYLVKPFSARELLARVRTHLEMAKVRREWEAELERRVQERTAQLLQTTQDLEAENAERQRAGQKLEAQLARMSLLDQITRAVAQRQDLRSIFGVVVRRVEQDLPADFCCMCLRDPSTNTLTVTSVSYSRDVTFAVDKPMRIDLDRNGLSACLQGQIVYEPDLGGRPAPFYHTLAGCGLQSLVAAPLLVQNQMFGILLAARHRTDAFSGSECEFLRQLSEHIALAARQAELHSALQTAYDDLRLSQETLMQQERLRALGEMASGIAHDINNSISPIAIYTESLLERDAGLSERARNCLVIIQRAIHDVASTVARMREFYRPREVQAELTRVDLNDLVNQVVALTRARWSDLPQRRGVAVELRIDLTTDLPQVISAEGEIRDALTNLIFNAVDAMPEGGTLTLCTRALLAESRNAAFPDQVFVEVSDTGVGMDDDTRRRCIEPFYTTKGEHGTGLGLAMVYGMTQRNGGRLEIESAVGKGTTVRLVFPVATSAPTATSHPSQPHAVRPLRILLIDDDPLLSGSLQDILQGDGHTVTTADGGQKGIDVFLEAQGRTDPFEVVITDLGMAHIDGHRVAASIKTVSSATPVFLLTGWGKRTPAGAAIPNIDHVLSKPPRIADIRAALAGVCAQSQY
jgi:signal transduction histidine kinase/DNA-binding response OmpR family regulator